MRLLACLFALAACQHADSAEKSAEIVKNAPAPAPAVAAAPAPAHEVGHSCGGACGAQCNGQCGAMCGGGEAPKFDTPASANWTALHVTGMHCGGCARRIERELAKVSGVLGVKADYSNAKVEVAVADGVDAKKLVSSTIDGLGYRVE
jgi:copper chaperone CopZ